MTHTHPSTHPRSYLDRYEPSTLPPPLFREGDLEAQAKLDGVLFQTKAAAPDSFDMESYFKHLDQAQNAAQPDTAQAIKAAYYAMIELIDDNVGRMLAALEQTGQRENTLIVFMSDHGEMLGDHGLVLKGCRFYEGLVRVPLILNWPGQIVENIQSGALVELTDIAPTLLDFCGEVIPQPMQGRSLRPILTGDAAPDRHRSSVRTEYYRTLSYLEQDVVSAGGTGTFGTMIRNERFKLAVYHGHDVGELFDLEADPGEFINLWDDPAYAEIHFQLMKESFDKLAFAVDRGPEQVTRF